MVWQHQIAPEDLEREWEAMRHQVGARAVLETIPLRAVTAEYVVGGWTPVSPPDFSSAGSGTPMPMDMVWNSDVPHHQVIWYEEGYLFQIFTSRGTSLPGPNRGACKMDKEDFIHVTESMR